MRRLTAEELARVEDIFLDHLTELLAEWNVKGVLGKILADFGLIDEVNRMLGRAAGLSTWPEGKILVVGAKQSMEKHLKGVAKEMGISASRIVFVTCDDATNFNFKELEYTPTYCAILFGGTPHSAKGKGSDESIISHIEHHRDRYAECRRLCNGGLKVTLSNFKEALTCLMNEGIVIAR